MGGGACSTYGGDEKYKVLVKKLEGNRPLRGLRHRWKDNIKLDIRETGCEDMRWIYLAKMGTIGGPL
jgi:hypothetical protein